MEFMKTKKYKFELRDFHYFLLAKTSHTQPLHCLLRCIFLLCSRRPTAMIHAPMTSEENRPFFRSVRVTIVIV